MPHVDLVETWPSLPLESWKNTYATLQLWLQIVGKVRLKQASLVNHWWQATFYLTSRGLTTLPISYGPRTFEVHFDFIDHLLIINTSDGASASLPLTPISVADFYEQFMTLLRSLDVHVRIWPVPVEIADPVPFAEDRIHSAYDREYVNRFGRILVQSARVFETFRCRFVGKCSPVHFFWGAFDLAVTRFSGRAGPKHPPVPNLADFVAIEAYSHEVSSCGFWPGGGPIQEPFYYAYAYPEAAGFRDYQIRTPEAFYSQEFGEFVLPYEVVRQANDPDRKLLTFLQGTYEAAAETGHWDRAHLERAPA